MVTAAGFIRFATYGSWAPSPILRTKRLKVCDSAVDLECGGALSSRLPRQRSRKWDKRPAIAGRGRSALIDRILIVEDSSAMRAFVRAALEEAGVVREVVEASSGFEALRILPREAFELAIVDINMPDVNGL